MNKTSKEDFEYFKKQCEYWQDRLSLRDWKLHYLHETYTGSYAWFRSDVPGKTATLGLSVSWEDEKITKPKLNSSARHEVLHLLLADLVYAGHARQSTDEDFENTQHAIIRRLEHVLEK